MSHDPETAATEERVRQGLRELEIRFEEIRCDPDLADTAAFCEHYGYAPETAANTIVVASKGEPRSYAACVVLATSRLDVNRAVRQRMGVRKASFANADETAALTGMLIGGVTPVGLPEELPLWIDAAVMDQPWVIIGGGSRSMKVKLAPPGLVRLGGVVVDGLASPQKDR
jgi:prolyl-tRNA editing enzyme YbaK/EbsC (Cys-tRNA(Pro) deacylase)